MTCQPRRYTSVAPYLVVSGAAQTINFLERVFDAKELRRIPAKDGRLRHTEVRIDDTVLMLADASQDWPPRPGHVQIYVPDVDATFRKSLAAGASSVQEPSRKDDADKRGGFTDTGGTTWWVATTMDQATAR